MLGKTLVKETREMLVDVIFNGTQNKSIVSRANTSKDPKESYNQFEQTAIGKLHYPVNLSEGKQAMFEKALASELPERDLPQTRGLADIVSSLMSTNKVEEMKTFLSDKDKNETFKRVKEQEVKEAVFASYKPMFNVFNSFGSEVQSMKVVHYQNELEQTSKVLEVIFAHNNETIYSIEFPFIEKDCTFYNGDSLYTFMWTPRNLLRYLDGVDQELEVIHPYELLAKKAVTWYHDFSESKDVHYEQERFDNIVKWKKGIDFMQNVKRYILNQKENSWDKANFNPVVWLDKNASDFSKWSYVDNIAINMSYEELCKYQTVRGLDLLTGSTAMPAVRCKIASNYAIAKEGHKRVLRKVRDLGEYADYMSDYKLSNIGTFKTSSKRDNSCTARTTSQLVSQQRAKRRVTIK